jgi:hypothetical protein
MSAGANNSNDSKIHQRSVVSVRGWCYSDLFYDVLAVANRSEDGDWCLGIFGCSHYFGYKRMSGSLICVDNLSPDVGYWSIFMTAGYVSFAAIKQ